MRRYGNSPERVSYRDRPGCYAVILRGDRLLLTQEQTEEGPEVQLPGGGVDPGEPFLRALHREVMEETGWRISTPRRLGTYQSFRWLTGYHYHARKVHHIFIARAVAQHCEPLEPNHHALWVPLGISPGFISNRTDAQFVADKADLIAAWAGAL